VWHRHAAFQIFIQKLDRKDFSTASPREVLIRIKVFSKEIFQKMNRSLAMKKILLVPLLLSLVPLTSPNRKRLDLRIFLPPATLKTTGCQPGNIICSILILMAGSIRLISSMRLWIVSYPVRKGGPSLSVLSRKRNHNHRGFCQGAAFHEPLFLMKTQAESYFMIAAGAVSRRTVRDISGFTTDYTDQRMIHLDVGFDVSVKELASLINGDCK